MEQVKRQTNYPNLVTECFGHGKKHYFIDVKKAVNDSHFILVTSSERYDENKYHRQTIQLWEEDLAFFVEALSMVLTQMTCGDGPRFFERPQMEVVKDPTGMKALASEDRPREKLHALGAGSLSNAELLAILFCTGSSELSVLDLCGKIMRSVKDDPARLLTRTTEDLCRFRGVGVAKAATLLAAMELGRRAFTHP
jgi:DNA repair protein RadC